MFRLQWVALLLIAQCLDQGFATLSPNTISWRVSSGLEMLPRSEDHIIQSHLIVPLKIVHPKKPLKEDFKWIWDQVPSHLRPHLMSIWNTTLLQALYPPDLYISLTNQSPRTKRSTTWQHYNPFAYVGWLQAKIFGTAHSFDLEDLQVSSENLSHFVEKLRAEVTAQKTIVGDYFGSITETEDALSQELSHLRNSTQAALQNIVGEIQVSKAVDLLQSRILVFLLEQTLYSEVMIHCQGNRLSEGMVSLDQLTSLLLKVSGQLPKNMEFSIPLSNLKQYYMVDLVHCLIGPNEIMVNLALPFSQTNSSFSSQIYEVKRIPYLHLNRTCWVTGSYPHLVAISNGPEQFLALNQEFCHDDLTVRRCYHRGLGFDFSEAPRCLLAILQPITVYDLTQLCRMECTPQPGWLGIIKMNSSTWYVSWQLFPITLHALNGTQVQLLPRPESPIMISITLLCGIYARLNNQKTLLGQSIDCLNRPTWIVKYHLPVWSLNYTELMLPPAKGYFDLPALSEPTARIKGHLSFQEKELRKYLNLNITQDPVPVINWKSPWTHSILWTIIISGLLILLLVFCIWKFKCRSSAIPLFGALSSIPTVRAEPGVMLSLDILTDALTLAILLVALIIIYRRIQVILKKRSCHDVRLPCCRLKSPAHLDLILPLDHGYIRIAAADLPLPATYYNPQGYQSPGFTLALQNGRTYCQFETQINLPDILGGSASVPETFNIPGKVTSGQGIAVITVSDNY